jgi:hypothetical protein
MIPTIPLKASRNVRKGRKEPGLFFASFADSA